MNIKPIVYESLTPEQRIVASFEALARKDEEERIRLIKTCPKKNYSMADPRFSATMHALLEAELIVECDVRGCLLDLFIHIVFEQNSKGAKRERIGHIFGEMPDKIQEMMSIRQAWGEILQEKGIDHELLKKADVTAEHFSIDFVEKYADFLDIRPDFEVVEKYKTTLLDYIEKCQS